MKNIKGKTGIWNVTIGLEVHAQINSSIKLFSNAPTDHVNFDLYEDKSETTIKKPNSMVTFFDAAMPGTLPVLNIDAIKQVVKTGLAIGAQINLISSFDRKNYFYPDLPHGYQITQLTNPIVIGGVVVIDTPEFGKKTIRINHIHIEQDAGKSIHDISTKYTYIDLNRAGIALMEIVSEADIESASEAAEYVKNLRRILRYVHTCTGNMEKGEFRCDANVSVKRDGDDKLGTRCEIKNLNSIKGMVDAINYEAKRQVEEIESGGIVIQETRLFDSVSCITKRMRTKEDSCDYRYFPDPDLLHLELTNQYVEEIMKTLPELPDQKKSRYIKDYGLTNYDAEIIVDNISTAKYFDEVALKCSPKLALRWITTELFGRLNKENLEISDSPVSSSAMIELIEIIQNDTISERMAKQVFDIMFSTQKSPTAVIKEFGLVQITDEDQLKTIIDEMLMKNESKVKEYKSGKEKLFAFFVGETMKLTSGKANPKLVNDIMKEKLK